MHVFMLGASWDKPKPMLAPPAGIRYICQYSDVSSSPHFPVLGKIGAGTRIAKAGMN